MRKEDETLGLEGQDLEEEFDVDEEEALVEGFDDPQVDDVGRAPSPPRSPTPSSVKSPSEGPETPEDTSELPTRNASPEPGQSKRKKNNKKGPTAKKGVLEPMSKSERRATQRNQPLDSKVEAAEPNGVAEGQPREVEETSAQVSELSKREKRRAKQAKKAEVASTPNPEVCFPSSMTTPSSLMGLQDSLQRL
jgi:DnaJ family protein A protein 5